MKKVLTLLILIAGFSVLQAQQPGYYGISLGGSFAVPVSDLGDLYKPSFNLKAGAGRVLDNGWYFEGQIDACRFKKTKLQGYAGDNVTMSLEYAGLMFAGNRPIAQFGPINLNAIVGAGPFYWKGVRSEISQNDSLGIPNIPQKTLEEWNMAFQWGAGLQYFVTPSMALEISGVYRILIGSLWPVMQEHIQIEQVNGFQILHINAKLRYYF